MGTTGVYDRGKYALASGQINLASDDIRVMLVNTGYVFSAKHAFADIVAYELSGSGYLRKKLTSLLVTQDDTNFVARWSASNPTWVGALFGTPDAAVVYKEGSSDAYRIVICSLNIVTKVNTNGGNYTLAFNSSGIVVIQ